MRRRDAANALLTVDKPNTAELRDSSIIYHFD